MQTVQTALLPFHHHKKTLAVPDGLTLEQIVDFAIPYKPRGLNVVVLVNGERIPRAAWSKVKPKQKAIVGINVVPMGGGGKKNPLATILSIALMVVAPYAAGALTASFITATGVTSLTAAQAVYAAARIGIGLVGFLASSMLSSVPKQTSAAAPTNIAESATQFIEGASNAVLKYGVVPMNLGVNRVFPPQAALPYTEVVGNLQFVRQLFTYGYGNVVVSDRKLGETLLTDFTNLTMEDRLNGDLDSGTSLYTNDTNQIGLSVALTNAAGYIVRTTPVDIDEAEFDVTFASLVAYNDKGVKQNTTVQFEIQYSPAGAATWSTGAAGKAFGSSSLVIPTPTFQNTQTGLKLFNDYGIILKNIGSGELKLISFSFSEGAPAIPSNYVRIASYRAGLNNPSPGVYTPYIITFSDDRAPNIPSVIADSGSFIPSYTGTTINVTSGTMSPYILTVTNSTTQALRVTRRFVFPTRGQYDMRIKRLTADAVNDRVRDTATLTSLRATTYTEPVKFQNISGTAMRIQGTDQLNGTVDTYNVILGTIIKDYIAADDVWIDAVSSNPASIYRYVLQCPAFVKALPDNRINLEKLQEWHAVCVTKNLTYNRVIDYEVSVEDLLKDIAAAGMATPHYVDGVYGVIIDNERPDIRGIITPRNSWGYTGNINYPEVPHALRVEFRNSENGYQVDERIVFQDGYDETNATLYERLSFLSCTDSDLAYFYGRTYLASIILQPETHKFNTDFENLTFNRGDRITFVNDVILVGVGSARIKTLIFDPMDATLVTGFTIDDIVSIPPSNNIGVRIRHADASGFIYYPLTTIVTETNTFTFTTPVDADDAPGEGSLCAFTEFDKELDLLVLEITANADQSAKVVAIDYAPERFTAASGAIPQFNSNVTIPIEFYPPQPPELASPVVSDESVMTRSPDGTYQGRMVIPLINRNSPSTLVRVQYRPTGANQWSIPDALLLSPDSVILTGLQDGTKYDIEIRYQNNDSRKLVSDPLQLNGQTYVGASTKPSNVTGFKFSVIENMGLFEWNANTDVDFSHYYVKFSKLTTDTAWTNAQPLAPQLKDTRATFAIQSGTYLIKAVDILGNESEDPAVIISIDEGATKNIVEFLQEQPTFAGTKVNCYESGGDLYLDDPTLEGIYYFDSGVSLGDVYKSSLSSSVNAFGSNYDPLATTVKIRSFASIRSVPSIRGIDSDKISVVLQMRLSQDNMATWGDWVDFTVGNQNFSDIEFRLVMNSFDPTITVRVNTLEVTVDMPDRRENGSDIAVTSSGITITYTSPFINNPAVNITLKDGATDDRIEYSLKDNTGFAFKVYNATSAGYVDRIFDYNSGGYGKVL